MCPARLCRTSPATLFASARQVGVSHDRRQFECGSSRRCLLRGVASAGERREAGQQRQRPSRSTHRHPPAIAGFQFVAGRAKPWSNKTLPVAREERHMPAGTMEQMNMSDGAEIAVYHIQPEGERRGGLVLVQEIFGVTEHIRDMADEYAQDGYEVLAPALFDREHPGFEAGYTGPDFERAVQLARQLHPFALSLKDVQTCVAALKGKGPVFVVGYCYGGR